VVGAALLAGCGSLHLAPYNGRGYPVAASTARSAAEPPLRYWPRVYMESAPVTLSRYVEAPAGSGTQK
jgi:hypothetical protein